MASSSLRLHTQAVDDGGRDAFGPLACSSALAGQGDGQRAVVEGVATAGDHAAGLQPLEQGGERRRLEAEARRQLADPQGRVLPEGQHHEVLRVGQSHRLEQGPVERDHVARGHRQGEADLPVELEQVGLVA